MSPIKNNLLLNILTAVTMAYAAPALSTPARAGSANLGEFTAATCVDTIGDLAKVGTLAQENNWAVETDTGQYKSAWTLAQDGTDVMVATLTARNQDLCTVAFTENKRPQRDEFVQALFGATAPMVIATVIMPANSKRPGGRMEIFGTTAGSAGKIIVQVWSYDDGSVLLANVLKNKRRQQ